MSPVGQLLEMQQRLQLHNRLVRQQRRDHIKHAILRQLEEMQLEYDQANLKIDGREG